MPRISSQKMEDRRQAILDAAIVCFSRSGFQAATMRDIFREAGMSAGAIYNYFKSKEEILNAVIDQSMTFSQDAVESSARADAPADAAFRALITLFMDDLEAARTDGRAKLASMVTSQGAIDPGLRARLHRDRALLKSMAAERLLAARPGASQAQAERLVTFIFCLHQGMMQFAALEEDPNISGMMTIIDQVLASFWSADSHPPAPA